MRNGTKKQSTQKPYVSQDRNGYHVLNSKGEIVRTFSRSVRAYNYLACAWNSLIVD